LLRDLFNATATLAKVLNVDADFSDRVTAAAKKLPPFMITSAGALQEWIEDYEPQVRSLLVTLLTGADLFISHLPSVRLVPLPR